MESEGAASHKALAPLSFPSGSRVPWGPQPLPSPSGSSFSWILVMGRGGGGRILSCKHCQTEPGQVAEDSSEVCPGLTVSTAIVGAPKVAGAGVLAAVPQLGV